MKRRLVLVAALAAGLAGAASAQDAAPGAKAVPQDAMPQGAVPQGAVPRNDAAPANAARKDGPPDPTTLLFETNQIGNAPVGQALSYRYTRFSGIEGAPFGPPIEDRIR